MDVRTEVGRIPDHGRRQRPRGEADEPRRPSDGTVLPRGCGGGELPEAPGCRLTPWTEDPAVSERWFLDEKGIGQDGIVAKRVDQPYLAGARGWVKVKHRRTADCVVGGYRLAKGGDGVGSLLLGL